MKKCSSHGECAMPCVRGHIFVFVCAWSYFRVRVYIYVYAFNVMYEMVMKLDGSVCMSHASCLPCSFSLSGFQLAEIGENKTE